VRSEVVERLLRINRGFYQSFADPFRATRGRLQPGVSRALESVNPDANVLDLGCAHGLLAEELAGRSHSGVYVGLDSSHPLLDSVPERLHPPRYQFALADLSDEEWAPIARKMLSEGLAAEQNLVESSSLFDWVFAFAVLHHLPSSDLRQSTVAALRSLLRADGRVAVSAWDFLASARLQKRVVAWNTVGVSDEDVGEGDYLVDWREGGSGVRYVHHFTGDELTALAVEAGFRVSQEYSSDGENSQLGLYQIWEVV
jgi:SAM-dependent methyltransferase